MDIKDKTEHDPAADLYMPDAYMRWATGKEAEIEEVECRAMGAPACVWVIGKGRSV
jgi:hypothetical protein